MTTLPYDSPAGPETLTRAEPLPARLGAAGPAQQRRWTVAIRLIMIIPHIFVLFFLNIAAGFVAFIGWWGALFTGRLPEFAYSYLSGYVRWYTRVQAYGALLLTDQYPPFSLRDEPDYPVRIAIPPRDRLNRFAVLFRIILVIPATIVNLVVQYGAGTIVSVVAWVMALITGKLPESLHLAYTAVLRYSTRLNCYSTMLAAAYPWGLFGDGLAVPDAPAPVEPDAPAESGAPAESDAGDLTPTAPSEETPEEASVDAEAPGEDASVDAEVPSKDAPEDAAAPGHEIPDDLAVPEYAVPVGLAAGQPADWRLLLTRGARRLLGMFIGIGIVVVGGQIASSVLSNVGTNNVATAMAASHAVSVANDALTSALHNYQNTVQGCTNAACAEGADGQFATAFTDFANTVNGTPMPDSAASAKNAVYADATKLAQDLTQLSHLGPTITPTQYGSTSTTLGISQTLNQLQTDYSALTTVLKNYKE